MQTVWSREGWRGCQAFPNQATQSPQPGFSPDPLMTGNHIAEAPGEICHYYWRWKQVEQAVAKGSRATEALSPQHSAQLYSEDFGTAYDLGQDLTVNSGLVHVAKESCPTVLKPRPVKTSERITLSTKVSEILRKGKSACFQAENIKGFKYL